MAGTPQPLDQKFPIVDSQGRPTDYFTRWAQQRQVDINQGITEQDLLDYLLTHKLQEGVGIQITPSGNLSDLPTIAADVQEILDTLSATRGVIIFRGLTGWTVLLPGTAGNVLQTNGPGADPTWVPASGGGGGGYPQIALTKPTAAQFTNINPAAGLTMTDKTFGVALIGDSTLASNALRPCIWNVAPGAAAFTMTARMALLDPYYAGFYTTCLFARNSSNGRIVVFGSYNSDTQPLVQNWTSFTGFSSDVNTRPNLYGYSANHPWRRITLAAGTLSYQGSPDGDVWTTVVTSTVASFLTAAGGTLDQVGFGMYAGARNGVLCQSFTLT